MTQCAKIIVGFMANVGNVFIQRLQTFFLFSPRFLTFLTVFFIFVSTFITSLVYVLSADGKEPRMIANPLKKIRIATKI